MYSFWKGSVFLGPLQRGHTWPHCRSWMNAGVRLEKCQKRAGRGKPLSVYNWPHETDQCEWRGRKKVPKKESDASSIHLSDWLTTMAPLACVTDQTRNGQDQTTFPLNLICLARVPVWRCSPGSRTETAAHHHSTCLVSKCPCPCHQTVWPELCSLRNLKRTHQSREAGGTAVPIPQARKLKRGKASDRSEATWLASCRTRIRTRPSDSGPKVLSSCYSLSFKKNTVQTLFSNEFEGSCKLVLLDWLCSTTKTNSLPVRSEEWPSERSEREVIQNPQGVSYPPRLLKEWLRCVLMLGGSCAFVFLLQ